MSGELERLVDEYGSEGSLAARIGEEMRRRGWSQARLAKEMAERGQPIHQSAISKILNPPTGESRRAVSVDEALAFARTFDVPLLELLVPSERLSVQHASKLLTEGPDAYRALLMARGSYEDLVGQLARLAQDDEEVNDLVSGVAHLANEPEASDSISALFVRDVLAAIEQLRDAEIDAAGDWHAQMQSEIERGK